MNHPVPTYATRMLNAKSEADLDAWVADGGDPLDMMRFIDHNPQMAVAAHMRAWLRREDMKQAEEKRKLERDATDAAVRSAKYAKHSAIAASIAVGVSLVALGVAVAALWKP